jgi:exosome complex component RRP45
MCVLQKAGGIPLATDEVMNVVQIASRRVKELDVMVDNVLKEDWRGRKVEIR